MRRQNRSSRASRSSVRPTTTSRATDQSARVTKRTHSEDRCGDSSGTPIMRGRASPMLRAVSSRICLPDSVAGPGTSNDALAASGRSSARTSAMTTSSIAIGCVRDFSQRGRTITGKRAARSRTISQLRLPKPDDHARAQLDRLDRAGPQRLAHREPAAQMLGAGARRRHAAEIHDALDPRRAAAAANVEAAATSRW